MPGMLTPLYFYSWWRWSPLQTFYLCRGMARRYQINWRGPGSMRFSTRLETSPCHVRTFCNRISRTKPRPINVIPRDADSFVFAI